MVIRKLRITLVDIEMGIIGAIGMFACIFLINLTGTVAEAARAAALHAVFSLFLITINTAIGRTYAKKSVFLAFIVPTLVAIPAVYLLHYFNQSPEPIWSTGFSLLSAIPGFLIQAYRFKVADHSLRWWVKKLWNMLR